MNELALKDGDQTKFTVEGVVTVGRTEDGGCAIIAESFPIKSFASDEDNGMFLTLQSWDDATVHTDMRNLIGKKIKITIEVVE